MAKNQKKVVKEQFDETIINVDYSEEMRKSYVDYALSVITDRALPDVRDGLKPVHRRILYGMKELGLKNSLPYKKSARIVGEVMGKYHPHGDASIYDAMAHMAQDWYYIYPLVDGHGNFGSIEGDEQAASRYTEARLSKISEELFLQDLEKGVVPFVPNFDDNEKEPTVLPVKIPNLLLSGTEGIAVGMASKIPTHNLGEIVDGTIAVMDKPSIGMDELIKVIKGPDFSTGGIIANTNDLKSIYESGTGKIRVRGKYHTETVGADRVNIVITEIPFTMIGSIERFLENIATLVCDKTLQDVSNIKNFSDKDGIRIVIETKKGADIDYIVNVLYKKAKFEDTFGYNAMAICNGNPCQLSLKDILTEFIVFNKENYRTKYTYLLEREEQQKEVREGLIEAVDCVDLIIEVLRGSTKVVDAKNCLMFGNTSGIKFKTKTSEKKAQSLSFTELQATAILEMKLQRLVGLEILSLQKELEQNIKNIEQYSSYLKSSTKMKNKIKKDLLEIKEKYGIPRKTELRNENEVLLDNAQVKEEQGYILIDKFGYTKTIDNATYERNADTISAYKYCIKMSNMDKLCVFTDSGKCHFVKGIDIPQCKYKDKGEMLGKLSNYDSHENIIFIAPFSQIENEKLVFVNEFGMCKIVSGQDFVATKRTVDATKKDSGKVVYIEKISAESDMCIKTKDGMFIRFKISEISEMKKTSVGVRGIKLKNDDVVVSAKIGTTKAEIDGISFTAIKLTKRDGVGIKKSLTSS